MAAKTMPLRFALLPMAVALLALIACSPEAPAPDEPATVPDLPGDTATPAEELSSPPSDVPSPEMEPMPPGETPPPPSEPSAVPKPTSAEPSLDAMHAATPNAKMSVPVDLRYQFDTDPVVGQPVMLHLAAVPRVAGTLQVSVKPVAGLEVAAGPLELRKAGANHAYRQQLSVTRTAVAPEALRVLVTMETPAGTGFGYFTIPLADGKTAQKPNSVKQR